MTKAYSDGVWLTSSCTTSACSEQRLSSVFILRKGTIVSESITCGELSEYSTEASTQEESVHLIGRAMNIHESGHHFDLALSCKRPLHSVLNKIVNHS